MSKVGRRREGPGPRLRRPVRAADRPAGARMPGLLRAHPLRHAGRRDPGARSRPGSSSPGGPRSVNEPDAPAVDPAVLRPGRAHPGHLLRAAAHGQAARGAGRAHRARPSTAARPVTVTEQGALFAGLPAEMACWMSHGDSVVEVPPGFAVTAQSPQHAGGGHGGPGVPGSTGCSSIPRCGTPTYGQDILKNFLYKICDIAPTWTPVSIIEEAVERIRSPGGRASGWSAACPAGWTPPWPPCSPTRRWATSSPASSSTTG